jgi:hypothetical protein
MVATSKDELYRAKLKTERGFRIDAWGSSSNEEGVMSFYDRENLTS